MPAIISGKSAYNLGMVPFHACHHLVQEALCGVGELFLPGPLGAGTEPLLPERAADDALGGAELLFGPVAPEEVWGAPPPITA